MSENDENQHRSHRPIFFIIRMTGFEPNQYISTEMSSNQ